MSTIAITGSSSGMGAALAARFTDQGHRVIGVDLRNADVEADLGTESGRARAVARLTELSGGRLDGFLPFMRPRQWRGAAAEPPGLGELLRRHPDA